MTEEASDNYGATVTHIIMKVETFVFDPVNVIV